MPFSNYIPTICCLSLSPPALKKIIQPKELHFTHLLIYLLTYLLIIKSTNPLSITLLPTYHHFNGLISNNRKKVIFCKIINLYYSFTESYILFQLSFFFFRDTTKTDHSDLPFILHHKRSIKTGSSIDLY